MNSILKFFILILMAAVFFLLSHCYGSPVFDSLCNPDSEFDAQMPGTCLQIDSLSLLGLIVSGATAGADSPLIPVVDTDSPSNLINTGTPHTITQGLAITTITSTYSGTVTSCTTTPALPAGLVIDNTTCAISGTPATTQAAASYTITATNAFGNTTAMASISVLPRPLVHFRFTSGSLLDSGSVGISLPTVVGPPLVTTGKDGDANGAYSFVGGNRYFASAVNGDAGLPMGSSPRTMCAWANPVVLPVFQNRMIFRYGLISPNRAAGIGTTRFGGSDYVGFYTNGGDIRRLFSLPLNTWSHLCATYTSPNTRALYLNGVILGVPTVGSTTNTTSGAFIVGVWQPAQFPWEGAIDDVRVYGLVLNATQINQIYNAGLNY